MPENYFGFQQETPDLAYAVGRVSVLEKNLLDRVTWQGLCQSDLAQAQATVEAHGYNSVKENADIAEKINESLRDAVEMLLAITKKRELIELFLLPEDAHNLNVLIKCGITGRDPRPLLSTGGAYDPEVLAACVRHGHYGLLGEEFDTYLGGIDKETPPRLISAAVDRAIYAHIDRVLRETNAPALREYFQTKADAVNVLAKSRAAALHWEDAKTKEMLVPAPDRTQFRFSGDYTGFERELNRKCYEKLATERYENDLVRIACYLIRKTAECRALRLLFAAKKAGISLSPEDIIPEGVA